MFWSILLTRLPLPIAPYWNWNIWRRVWNLCNSLLPIAPYWNWNRYWFDDQHCWWTTNRTILELKLARPRTHSNQEQPTNRTILELKLVAALPFLCRAYYQSHHTGIETAILNKNSELLKTTNRTILELKLMYLWPSLSCTTYQSHHTGIETRQHSECYWYAKATNRTILELKLKANICSSRYRCTTNRTILELKHLKRVQTLLKKAFYQSHHTGIETFLMLPIPWSEMATNRTILELKHWLLEWWI